MLIITGIFIILIIKIFALELFYIIFAIGDFNMSSCFPHKKINDIYIRLKS